MNVEQQAPTSTTRLPEAVYAQRRMNVALGIIALITLLVVALSSTPKTPTELVTVTVTNGQTLWSLAEEFAPEDRDIREWIYEVQQLNDLKNSALFPGMQLTVPMAVEPGIDRSGRGR